MSYEKKSTLIASTREAFEFEDGRRLSIDLFDAVEKIDSLYERLQKGEGAPAEGELTYYQMVADFQAWAESNAAEADGEVEISRGEADALMDAIRTRFAEAKKARRGSPSSPPSTPDSI